jgi:hypothetical protein
MQLSRVYYQKKKERKKRKRKLWTKQWLERNHFTHIDLLQELKCFSKDWSNYLRMDESTYLLRLTNMRKAITPNERLTATLRYLATGRTLEDSYLSSSVGKSDS